MTGQNVPESAPEPPEVADTPANPAAMPMDQLARMLGLSIDHLRRHMAQGAPTNANGSINLVHYAAWLNRNTAQPVATGGAEGDAEGGAD